MSQATNIIEDIHVELCDAEASLTMAEGKAPGEATAARQSAVNSLMEARRKLEHAQRLIEEQLIYEPA